MKKLLELIKKNFKLLIRSRFSALIILIGPILIMLLAGLAFSNTNQYSLHISTFSESYNELTNSYINNLEQTQYTISKAASEESCINGIQDGSSHVCIVFPKDFQAGNENQNQINFYVDYSKINMVYVIIESVTSEISESSSALSMNMTSNILSQIEITEAALKGKDELLTNLISKNSEIDTSLTEMQATLVDLDLTYDSNDFQTASISSYSSQLRSSVSDIYEETDDVIDEVSDLLVDLEDDIDNLSISGSEKDDLIDQIEDINNVLVDLENSTSEIYTESKNKSTALSTAIDQIDDSLGNIETQLSSAGSAKSSLLTKVASIKEKISTTRVSLLDLQNAVNTINQGISTVSLREAEDIVNPTEININPIISEKTHLNYFFPSLLTLVIMFVSILLSSNIVMMEKTSTAHLRNHLTPTKDILFLLSNYFTCLIIMLFQILLLLIISIFLFKVSIDVFSLQFLVLTLLALIISTVFILLGMSIGYLFKSRETTTLGAISVATILFVLSDIIVPKESIPANLSFLTEFNPFMISVDLFRQVILFGKDLLSLTPELYYLLIYFVIFFALTLTSLIRFKKTHIMEKFSKGKKIFFFFI